MVPNSLGQNLTPSAVSIDDEGNIYTGMAARERQSTHASQTVTAFKRYMGTSREIKLGKRSFRPEELSALVLKSIKADAEAFLGEPVTEAVITVPAYFNNKQRTATRNAGELAGLKVERLLNEPTAAALAYGLAQRDLETKFLVFDLGGGTFDISILEIFDGIIEVRASAGDNRLGGEDFNAVLIALAQQHFKADIGASLTTDAVLFQRLREAAERCRRTLSTEASAALSFVWKDKDYNMEIDAVAFEEACAPLLTRLREPILRAMGDSRVDLPQLDEIILVGGSTRMPIVRKAVTKMFGRFPNNKVDADEAVARGAAVQAGLKARDAALSEVVLTDVSPFSLGVETSEQQARNQIISGIFSPIIERNCAIPASREHSFTTMADYQSEVKFPIYQGESRWVRDNILLGEITVNIPKAKAGTVDLKCRFTYDINGLLEVDVYVASTGVRKQLLIADKDDINPKDLERMRQDLQKLKIHPRDNDVMQAALNRAGRCYEGQIGEGRIWVGALISDFEATLDRQDPRECAAAAERLHEQLDTIEGPSLL